MNLLRAALKWLLEKHVKEEKPKMSKIVLVLSALTGVVANGTAANTLSIQVTDDTGTPLGDQVVTLTADAGVNLSATIVTTDSAGGATAELTSTTSGTYQTTATLADGTAESISVVFLEVPAPVAVEPVTEPVPQTATAKAVVNVLAGNMVRDFDAAFDFVRDGVEKLGETAKADLIYLAKKYL